MWRTGIGFKVVVDSRLCTITFGGARTFNVPNFRVAYVVFTLQIVPIFDQRLLMSVRGNNRFRGHRLLLGVPKNGCKARGEISATR